MSLSSLIVQREVASIRQVEEALARQVLYGGDLVTNLLEVVQLPEAVLLPLLAESVGAEAAPVGMLPAPTAQARALVPEDVASRRLIVPLSVEGDRLILAVSEPLARDVEDELSFALGVRIEQRVAPSVRIHEALARVYGVPLDRRMSRLVGRLAGVDPSVPNSLPPLRAAKASVPPLPGALSHDLPRLNPPGMPAMGTMRFPDAAPQPRKSEAPRARYAPYPTGVLPSLVGESRPSKSADAPRRRGPVTLERVTVELSEISDREALLQLFFDFARQFFEYSAIFVVQGDVAEGRDAYGDGASRERALALGVPLDIPGVFGTVRRRAAPLCTFPAKDGLDAMLMTDLRRDPRSQVLLVPIVVRSRVVAIFIGDDGEAGIAPGAQGEIITVAALVGREFERLIVRMKLQGFSGEAPTRERRIDPARVEPKRRRRDPEAREAAVQALVAAAAASQPDGVVARTGDSMPVPGSAQASSRPGALRPDALTPAVSQRAYGTLRDFPATSVDEPPSGVAEDEKVPHVSPVAPDEPTTLQADEGEPAVPVGRLARADSEGPPPSQTVAVRHPSGPPIPRAEDDDGSPLMSQAVAPEHISSRPPPADLRQARLLREIDAITATFVHSEPISTRSPGSFRPGQAVTLPPHLPPSSRIHLPLPSVIVDVTGQTEQLVQAFVNDPADEQLEAELLRLGQEAMPSIMQHFPGPLTITRDTLDDTWPRVSECGPVLRLIAGQRRVALPFVVARMDDPLTETRFWATYLLTELAYPEAIPAVVARLFDDSKRVRRAARIVAHVLAEIAGAALVAELDRIVRDPKATSPRRVVTLDALGEMRDPLVVPVLLGGLGDDDEDVALASRRALMLVTRQDFGRDTRRWLAWWNLASSRHRIEWLIDALTHEMPALRRAAGQELKALTEEYFGYYDDLPKKERERAQQRYREWWRSEGHTRFKKA